MESNAETIELDEELRAITAGFGRYWRRRRGGVLASSLRDSPRMWWRGCT